MTAALFDLDRTLLDCNSARLWLEAEWRAGRVRRRDAARAVWFLLRYSLGHAGLAHAVEWAVGLLEGEDEAQLSERTLAWFEEEVRDRLRPGAVAALATHRRAGERLVLATSSSRYMAEAACEAFGLDEAICTRFEVDGGRFTGRVETLAYGAAKLHCARRWADAAGVDLSDCAFYTDSFSDLPLLEAVGRPVVVDPDPRLLQEARRRGWEICDWGP